VCNTINLIRNKIFKNNSHFWNHDHFLELWLYSWNPTYFFLVLFVILKNKSWLSHIFLSLSSSSHTFSWFHFVILNIFPLLPPPFPLVSFTSCGEDLHSFLPYLTHSPHSSMRTSLLPHNLPPHLSSTFSLT
jgi:hypothetical protein